jgi:hypothetical protein
MTDKKDIQYKLYELEKLFHNSATYGISLFQTLSLPEDDKGTNAELLENFQKTLENKFEDNNMIEYHIENLKYIRQHALSDPKVQNLIESKINEIREKIAMDLIVNEDNLGVEGDFNPFEPER